MRTSFIQQLINEAEQNEKIFLLVGDLGYSVVEPFSIAFPDRFLNVGVAEQNMTGIASGLAMEGYCVFIYSIGNFPTLRNMEQIRYDICYHNLNVKIVSVGGGFSYGPLGPSHHATEELGMLRTIPNLLVCAPGDPNEAKAITSFCVKHKGPCYIRLGKAGEAMVHEKMTDIALGDIVEVIKGREKAIFSTGSMLKYAADFVLNNSLDVSVYSFPFVKPMNNDQLLDIVSRHKRIITIEEHQSQAGFGSAVLEVINDLAENGKLIEIPFIKRIAIRDEFISVAGSQDYLRKLAGLVLKKEYFV